MLFDNNDLMRFGINGEKYLSTFYDYPCSILKNEKVGLKIHPRFTMKNQRDNMPQKHRSIIKNPRVNNHIDA